jgi:hypothetical protein
MSRWTSSRRYPLLFQTGETAYGKAIVDGQHPHNFIMALGFHYAYQLSENTTLSAYFAPVGDPALGPVAFPHRASAMELPEAPISHHWQDSTHIADEVVTVGITHKKVRLEASGFQVEYDETIWATRDLKRQQRIEVEGCVGRVAGQDGSFRPLVYQHSELMLSTTPTRGATFGD